MTTSTTTSRDPDGHRTSDVNTFDTIFPCDGARQLTYDRFERLMALVAVSDEQFAGVASVMDSVYATFNAAFHAFQEDHRVLMTPVVDFAIYEAFRAVALSRKTGPASAATSFMRAWRQLNRVLVGWAVHVGKSISTECDVDDGVVVLPHASMSVRVATSCHEIRIDVDAGRLIFDGTSVAPESIEALPRLKIGSHEIVLDGVDPCYGVWLSEQPFSGEIAHNKSPPKGLERWIVAAENASVILSRFWPEFVTRLEDVRTIVPIEPASDGDSLSCSSEMRIGAVMASLVPGVELAEMLVHEYGHNLLNRLMRTESYVKSGHPVTLYSPLRPDPRPPKGLLHAAYSSVLVSEFYRRLCADPRYHAEYGYSYSRSVIRSRAALASLDAPTELTVSGEDLVRNLSRLVAEFESSPFFRVTPELIENELQSLERFEASHMWGRDSAMGTSVSRVRHALLGFGRIPATSTGLDTRAQAPYSASVPRVTLAEFVRLGFDSPMLITNLPLLHAPKSASVRDFLLTKFGHKTVEQIDLSKHYGRGDTPRRTTTLAEHLASNVGASSANPPYLGEQSIGEWAEIRHHLHDASRLLLENFWLDNHEMLFFANGRGTVVKLHFDSSNNLHFNLSGRKEFFLLPPGHHELLREGEAGYSAGFSAMDPFEGADSHAITAAGLPSIRIVLGPDECLFLPNGWWHGVRYIDDCCSITCFDRYQRLFGRRDHS